MWWIHLKDGREYKAERVCFHPSGALHITDKDSVIIRAFAQGNWVEVADMERLRVDHQLL